MNMMTSLTPVQELVPRIRDGTNTLPPYREAATNERSTLRTLIGLVKGEGMPSCPGRYYDLRDLLHALKEAQEDGTQRRGFLLSCLGEKEGDLLLDLVVPFLEEYFSTCRNHKTATLLEFSLRERDTAVRLIEEFSGVLERIGNAPIHFLKRPGTKTLVNYGRNSVHPVRDADL